MYKYQYCLDDIYEGQAVRLLRIAWNNNKHVLYLIALKMERGGVGRQEEGHIGKTAPAAVDGSKGHERPALLLEPRISGKVNELAFACRATAVFF